MRTREYQGRGKHHCKKGRKRQCKFDLHRYRRLNCHSTRAVAEIVAPHNDGAANRQNYKTEHHPARTALLADETDAPGDAVGETSAGVAERTGSKTGPASVINDTRKNIQSSYTAASDTA